MVILKTMTYQEATDYLFSRRARGMKLGLENMQNLLKRLDHPEHQFPSIHIAGTNGKGSTAAILESILREAGYRTGLYTSPHLIDMRERIKIRGKTITQREVVEILERLIPHVEATGASFFELLTAMAFLLFSEKKVDLAILETGLGGRLDATNVVTPVLTTITEIGLEHTRILGERLKSISQEKAGILKPGIPCLAGAKNRKVRKFLTETAQSKKVPMLFSREAVQISRVRLTEGGSRFDANTGSSFYRDLHLRLLGIHQVENSALALLAVEELRRQGWKIKEGSVRTGLKKVAWRARLELLQENPKLLLDSAHNPLGMRSLVKALKTLFEYDRLILVFGVLKDKSYRAMLAQIAPLADRLVLTRPLNDRALEPERLLRLSSVQGKQVEVIPDIQKAWTRGVSLAEKDDLVCGAGSIYFVGEVLRIWEDKKNHTKDK